MSPARTEEGRLGGNDTNISLESPKDVQDSFWEAPKVAEQNVSGKPTRRAGDVQEKCLWEAQKTQR
jgi:hypothetical protein